MRNELLKLAGMSENLAAKLLGAKRHSLAKGFFGGGALGTAAGGTYGATTALKAAPEGFSARVSELSGTPEEVLVKGLRIGYGITGGLSGGVLGSAGGVLTQHLRNRATAARVNALAKKLRTGAGVTAGAGAGAVGLAAYKKRKD